MNSLPQGVGGLCHLHASFRYVVTAMSTTAATAPPNGSSFSVSVVFAASGCEMMANVRRRDTSRNSSAGLSVHSYSAGTREQ